MTYSICRIAKIICSKTNLLQDGEIRFLLTDSRSLFEPSGTVFFALKTTHNDGHQYIGQLYERGVRHFIVSQLLPEYKSMIDANFLVVENTLAALQQLAVYHRSQFTLPIIGITGSNGKTVTKEWLYQLLHREYNIVRSPRSYNSQLGVPLSVWQLNENSDLGIFEAGISLPGEMRKLEAIIRPQIGIVTNIGEAHQENFASLEEKCLEKLQLFRNSEVLICCLDNDLLMECIRKTTFEGRLFTWSRKNFDAVLYFSEIQKKEDDTLLRYRYSGVEDCISIPFMDDASIENAIHCLATTLLLSIPIGNLKVGFVSLEPVAMRLDLRKGIHGNTLINDTYNSDINSLSIALDFMSRRSMGHKLKSVLILSDILQSAAPYYFYQKVADLVAQKKVQLLIGIGSELGLFADLFSIEKEFYSTTEAFLGSGCLNKLSDSVILIKGSRNFRFEQISEQLEEKVHQTVLEVDLDAIVHNFKYFKSKLNPCTKIICMVKAFGYGIGSYELAKTLQDQACDYLAVAVADEGAELRKEEITMPILVMNPEIHSFNTLIEYNLEPEIYNFRILNAMIRETERRGILHYPVHIKFNTGMNRLGFEQEDIEQVASLLLTQQGLRIASVFSHLAGSDSSVLDDFTHHQMVIFTELTEKFSVLLGYTPMKHILNSAGMERFPEYQQEMIRLGIGLYGISVLDSSVLRPVASLKTTILQIRKVKKGESVGYNRNEFMEEDSLIACLPIGYADGLDRRLGNGKAKVYINGVMCPLVGNICMDICMVNVTKANAKEGDSVIVFGKEISITELARQLDTIPYEILTSISPRVKRVYFRE